MRLVKAGSEFYPRERKLIRRIPNAKEANLRCLIEGLVPKEEFDAIN